MTGTHIRVAIYARVSTDDRGQDPLNQQLQLREFASRHGWIVVREYMDQASAASSEREGFKRLWVDIARRRFDLLLFWSLDRFTREGTFKTLFYLKRLSDAGVAFKSYSEPYIDSLGVFSDAIVGIIAAIAQQERQRISERTKAGLARVKKQGKRLGRPRLQIDLADVKRLQGMGKSLRAIAKEIGVSPALVCNRLASDKLPSKDFTNQ